MLSTSSEVESKEMVGLLVNKEMVGLLVQLFTVLGQVIVLRLELLTNSHCA